MMCFYCTDTASGGRLKRRASDFLFVFLVAPVVGLGWIWLDLVVSCCLGKSTNYSLNGGSNGDLNTMEMNPLKNHPKEQIQVGLILLGSKTSTVDNMLGTSNVKQFVNGENVWVFYSVVVSVI